MEESVALKIGEVLGMILAFGFMLAIPVVFIICLVKLAKTKKKSWLIGTIVCALPMIAFVGLVLFGVYQGVKTSVGGMKTPAATTGTSSTASNADRFVEIPNSNLSIELPGDWTIMDDLNEEAELGAANLLKEQYLVVFVEPKVDFAGDLDEYAELTSSHVIDGLSNSQVEGPEQKTINGLPVVSRVITGALDTTNVYYIHTSYESEDSFGQIIVWTLPSKQAEALPVLEKVVSSFTFR